MFQKGDYVMHPGHGGCIITGTNVRPYEGADAAFYSLKPIMDENCQVYVPMKEAQTIGVRPVISPEMAERILAELPHMKVEWLSDFKQRRDMYSNVLKKNDLLEIGRMVKAFVQANEKNQSSATDRALFTAGKKKLISELALALGKSADAIEETVSHQLKLTALP